MRHPFLSVPVVTGLLAALTFAADPGSIAAQVTVVDEGTFSIVVRGTRVGREDFSIRRTAAGTFVAQGNVLRGDARSTVVLHTDSSGVPERFRFSTIRDGREEESVSGERRLALWSGLATRPSGETGSEFRLPAGILVAADIALHHLWFVVRFTTGAEAPALHPRLLTVGRIVVQAAGADSVTMGLEKLEARKWTIRETAGTAPLREVWTDPQGRLLRIRVPSEDLEALRDEPPTETSSP